MPRDDNPADEPEAQLPGAPTIYRDRSSAATLVRAVPGPVRNLLNEVGNPAQLLWRLIMTVVRNPRGFWGDTLDETAYVARKVFLPATITVITYGNLVVLFAIVVLNFLGAANRIGAVYLSFVMRETAPFLVGTVVAGVIGTATTSELGARKIREELDALVVLGQDPVRLLVLPRVIAITVVTVAMNYYAIFFQLAEGLIGDMTLGNTSAGAFLSSFLDNLTLGDLLGNLAKMTLMGLFIGVVCASKGMNASQGAEGVGRAVNQAVVISVMAAFVVSVIFNMVLLGANPDITVFR